MYINKKCFYVLLLLFTILIINNVYSQNNTYSPKEYLYKIYEFHVGYIKVTQYKTYILPEIDNIDKTEIAKILFNRIKFGGSSQYDTGDLYDINYSSNIQLAGKKFTNDNWRGTVYYNPSLNFVFSPPDNINFSSIWVSYKLKSSPLLHTRKPLTSDQEFHLGINSSPVAYLKKNICVLAFPSDTKITEIFHHLPTMQENFDDWILLIYDLTEIEDNVGYHVKFILSPETNQEINIDKLIQNIK